MKHSILFIALLFYSSYRMSTFGCMSPTFLFTNNLSYFSDEFENAAKKEGVLDALISSSKVMGKGAFGVVRSFDREKDPLVMKVLQPKTPMERMGVVKEIMLLKKICGVNPRQVMDKFISCEGQEIAAFKGCVEKGSAIYIFQRKAFSSLENKALLDKYRDLRAIKRAVVMLKILDKVVRLHKKQIIHSDIKPANIVAKDSDLQDFELIDLGLAGFENSDFCGGTKVYLPPEIRSLPKILTPQIDVYSLAITLLNIEGEFHYYYESLDSDCFKRRLTYNCHQELIDGVPDILSNDRGLGHLIPVFNKALAYRRSDRYSSVEAFSRDIVKLLSTIPNHKCYLSKILNEKENKTNQPSAYNWKDYARELGYAIKPLGFFEKLGRFFVCGGNKDKKSVQKSFSTELDDAKMAENIKIVKEVQCIECRIEDEVEQEPEIKYTPKQPLVVRSPGYDFEGPLRAEELTEEMPNDIPDEREGEDFRVIPPPHHLFGVKDRLHAEDFFFENFQEENSNILI